MMPIDNVIAKMKRSDCLKCRCLNATFDDTGEKVEIFGSFCNITTGFDQIEIIANRISDNKLVWNRLCDIGKICSIPFTSTTEFECYN